MLNINKGEEIITTCSQNTRRNKRVPQLRMDLKSQIRIPQTMMGKGKQKG